MKNLSRIFSEYLKDYSPNLFGKRLLMHDFLEFLYNLFIDHNSEHFFSAFLKPFSDLFQLFSKFHQISTQFLHICSFSKLNLIFPHNFTVKSSYFLRSYPKMTWNFSGRFIKFPSKYVLNVYEEFPRFFQ